MGLQVAGAHGCTLVDADGVEHIDLLAGIGVAATGHGDPRILDAIRRQSQRYLHVMVYGEFIQEPQVALAERLISLLPEPLQTVYFTNSGTEAVEGALKLARKSTGRSRLCSFRGGFHGDTLGAVSVGGNPIYRDPFEPLLPEVELLRFNDQASLAVIDGNTAAVIVEPVQAEAGVILPDAGFLEALRRRCTETGTLLIFDEVITGLGRTGTLFAFERSSEDAVVPDILVLAKALGGGLPLGAFVCSHKTARAFAVDPPLGHVTTFGGHPLSCAAGLASLEIILGEGLAARAETTGARFEAMLRDRLAGPRLDGIRRAGLLLGLQMDNAATVEAFTRHCRRERLVVGWTLHDDTVVRLAPPLVISDEEIDEAARRMQRALTRLTP